MVAGFDDPRLRYVRWEENAGIVGNFTRSLLGASTEYVIQLGDDDIAAPALVARTVAALDAFPRAGVAHSRFSLIDGDGAVLMAAQDWLGTPSPPLEPGAVFVERSMVPRLPRVLLDRADPALGGARGRLPARRTRRRSTSPSGCGWPSGGTSRSSTRCCASTGSTGRASRPGSAT